MECSNIMRGIQCNGQFFPSQVFPQGKNGQAYSFPGKKLTGKFFPPGKDLTSQFFPTQSVTSPYLTFSEKA